MGITKRVLRLATLLSFLFCGSAIAGEQKITWAEPELGIVAFPGTSQIVETSFTTATDHEDLSLWLTPSLAQFIQILPETVDTTAGTPNPVQLLVSVPADTAFDDYDGTLHIKKGKRTLSKPLSMVLSIAGPDPSVTPDEVSIPSFDRISQDPSNGSSFIRDEALIGLREGFSVDDVRPMVTSIGGILVGGVSTLEIYQVMFADITDADDLDRKIVELMAFPGIEMAGRSWLHSPRKVPNDPDWSKYDPNQLWDEANPSGSEAALEYIKLPSAWDYETGDPSIRVAVLDKGFDVEHEDLKGQIVADGGLLFRGPTQHGTMVAGIIGATGDNETGVTGVLWDSSLLLYGLELPWDLGISSISAIDAAEDALDLDINILNYSYGGPYSAFENWAWKRLALWSGKNTLFVFATDNGIGDDSNSSPSSLANDPDLDNVISVTAISYDDQTWAPVLELDGFGGNVSVAAPGFVHSTSYLKNVKNWYGGNSGTSFATPLVSGLAGLIWSVNPNFSPKQVKEFIVSGAEQGGERVPGETFHVINAAKSLELATAPPPPPPQELVTITATGRVFSISEDGIQAPSELNIGDSASVEIQYLVSDATVSNDSSSYRQFGFVGSENATFEVNVGGLTWLSDVPRYPANFSSSISLSPYTEGRGNIHFHSAGVTRSISPFVSFPGYVSGFSPSLSFRILSAGVFGLGLLDSPDDLTVDGPEDPDCDSAFGIQLCVFLTVNSADTTDRWDIAVKIDPSSLAINGESVQGSAPAIVYDEALDGDLDEFVNDPAFSFKLGRNVIAGSTEFIIDEVSGTITSADYDGFTFSLPSGSSLTRIEYEYFNVSGEITSSLNQLAARHRVHLEDRSRTCAFARVNVLFGTGSHIYDICDGTYGAGGLLSMPIPAGPLYRWGQGLVTDNGGSWSYRLTFVVE